MDAVKVRRRKCKTRPASVIEEAGKEAKRPEELFALLDRALEPETVQEEQGLTGPGQSQGLAGSHAGSSLNHAEYKDQVWECDLFSVETAAGPVEILTVFDEYTRECLSASVENRISLEKIIDRLFNLFVLRDVPKRITLGDSLQTRVESVSEWIRELPAETVVVKSGSRWMDEAAGPLGRKLRNDLRGGAVPASVEALRATARKWKISYNETRPQHSPLEDEAQEAQFSGGVAILEPEPSAIQTVEPGSDRRPANNGSWETRLPRWSVYPVRALEYAAIGLIFILLAGVVLALLAPHFGWRVDTVLSGSMEPALPVGSVEVTRPVNTADIQVGDIITFRSPINGELMSHRVQAVEEGETLGFRTKGDNNEDVDPYVIPAENVVGRYAFRVDKAGRIAEYLKTPLGFILLGLFGFALIAAEISTMLEVRWKEAAPADTKAK